MSKLFGDWRNPVLVLAIIGTIVFGSLWMSSRSNTPVITVNNRVITEHDVVSALKAQQGFNVVRDLVNENLLADYAQKQGITVDESDVDQMLRFDENQMSLPKDGNISEEVSFPEQLRANGLSVEALKARYRVDALQVKLLVPQADRTAAVNQYAQSRMMPFAMPTRYRLRFFTFNDKATAQEAITELQAPDANITAIAGADIDRGAGAEHILIYVPGLPKTKPNTLFDNALKGLADGQCSQPFSIPGRKDSVCGVVQLVEKLPAVLPTYQNCNLIVGQMLLSQNADKYAPMVQELQSKMLSSADIQIVSPQYEEIGQYFKDLQKKNPVIGSGASSKPATGTTGNGK